MKITEVGDTHEEALSRLCFVCAEIITETKRYDVEKHVEFLFVGLSSPGFSPSRVQLRFISVGNVKLFLGVLSLGKKFKR